MSTTAPLQNTAAKTQSNNNTLVNAALLQRYAEPESRPQTAAPASVEQTIANPGKPLDATARAFFEPRFGHDFSRVRVHTDAHAAKSARDVHALAFTVGRDMVFGEGQYAPHSSAGQRLLAHELSHTIQQSGHTSFMPRGLELGRANDRYEQEADRVANRIMAVPPHSTGDGKRGLDTTASLRAGPRQVARQLATPTDVAESGRPALSGESGATPMSAGPECSLSRGRGQSLPLANTAFRGERGFANIPLDGEPGPGGLLVTGNSVSIRISARWEEQIPDPAQRPPDQRNRRADRPQYYLTFNGWADDCEIAGVGSPASSVQSGNLAIGTQHTVSFASLIPGRYGLHINPSTAAPEYNRVLTGNCEVT